MRRRQPHRPDGLTPPHGKYLADFEPDLEAPNPIHDLIEHDRRVSRLRKTVSRLAVRIRRGTKTRDWIRLADAFAVLRGVEAEVAFDLGFENGFVAGRTSRSARRPKATDQETKLRDGLLRVVAGTHLRGGAAAAVLMEIGAALVRREGRR